MRISNTQLEILKLGKNPRRNKYNARKVVIDGITFDSTKEGNRYLDLKLQEHCGVISDLELQVEYILQESFVHKGERIAKISYYADFQYKKDGKIYTEDSKGFKTEIYRIKKKLLLKRFPDINFIET